ncbi:DUF1077-domain-containing protein [Cytidiella melzeri]|nr:DUF1077-domain-containing protein [Cytidiella melzeri]
MSNTVDSSKWRNLHSPPGFSCTATYTSSHTNPSASALYKAMKDKRAWDLAISPAKSLPMQAFMLYMSGGGVQVFSMGIVFMLLLSPFKNVAGINTAFVPLAPVPAGKKQAPEPNALTTLALHKLVYLLCNLLTLAIGLWKCRSMGLLPTGTGDWLAFETQGQAPSYYIYILNE